MRVKLVVYCDEEPDPFIFPVLALPPHVSALRALIEERTKHKARLISFWNFQTSRYDVLERVSQLAQPQARLTPSDSSASSSSPQRERDPVSGMQMLSESSGAGTRTSATLSSSQRRNDGDKVANDNACFRAQVWVESSLLVLEPIEPDRDEREFSELAQHVRQHMGNAHVSFTLQQASRVQFGYLARQFDAVRRDGLHSRSPRHGDARARRGTTPSSSRTASSLRSPHRRDAEDVDKDEDGVRMLYYANNAWPVSTVLQFGFLVRDDLPSGNVLRLTPSTSPEPSPPTSQQTSPQRQRADSAALAATTTTASPDPRRDTTRNPFIFSSSMVNGDEHVAPGGEGVVQKVLLCEVAPGRSWLSDCPLTGPGSESAPHQPPTGYDSILFYHTKESNSTDNEATPGSRSARKNKANEEGKGGTAQSDGLAKAARAPTFTQVRVSRSHQALPRYVLYVKAAAVHGGRGSPEHPRSAASAIASFIKAPIHALRSSPHKSSEARVEEVTEDAQPRSSSLRRREVTPPPPAQRRTPSPPPAAASPASPQFSQQRTLAEAVKPSSVSAASKPKASTSSTNTSFHITSSPSGPAALPPGHGQSVSGTRGTHTAPSPRRGDRDGTVLYVEDRLPSPPRNATAYYAPTPANASGRSAPTTPASYGSRQSTNTAFDAAPRPGAQQAATYQSHYRPGGVMVRDASSYGQHQETRRQSQTRRSPPPAQKQTNNNNSNNSHARARGDSVASSTAAAAPGLLYSSSLAQNGQRPRSSGPPAARQASPQQRMTSPLRAHQSSPKTGASQPNSLYASPSNGLMASPRASGIFEPKLANSAAFRCPLHRTYLTSLYCRTCQELTCPYCASVGVHRGHDTVEANEQAGRVSRQVQDLCAELSKWLSHFSRIESQLAVEQSDAARRQGERTQHLHAQMQELRHALDQRERQLTRQLTATASMVNGGADGLEDPLRAVTRVCAKYRRALGPLESVLRQYHDARCANNNNNNSLASSPALNTTTLTHTLQFLRTAPDLEREALAYFERHDKHEEAQLQIQVGHLRDANERAEHVLQAIQVAPLKSLIEQLGTADAAHAASLLSASQRGTTPRRAPSSANSSRDAGTPGRERAASLSSPSRSRYDVWSTVSPSRPRPGGPLSPRTSLARPNRRSAADDSTEDMDAMTTTTTTCSSSNAQSGGSPRKAHVLTHRCLLDLQRGHIWVIEDAARYFQPGQAQAVCSTPFRLLNARWEVRIGPLPKRGSAAAAGLGGNGPATGRRISFAPAAPLEMSPSLAQSMSFTPAASTRIAPLSSPGSPALIYEAETGEEEWLGLFLFPLDHALRMDFRVIAFSEVCWMEWKVQGWGPEYTGKGWGLYPFLKRKDLMRTDKLACDNNVKLCIAPISDLY